MEPQVHRSEDRDRQKGFTLIEIMAVVIIMGLLMGVVGIAVFGQVDKARFTTAKTKLSQLESALEFYRLDNSRYPTTEQGLEALVRPPSSGPTPRNFPKGGYLSNETALLDPWDHPYSYESPGQRNSASFDLCSMGADQTVGGSDTDADICNWGTDEPAGG